MEKQFNIDLTDFYKDTDFFNFSSVFWGEVIHDDIFNIYMLRFPKWKCFVLMCRPTTSYHIGWAMLGRRNNEPAVAATFYMVLQGVTGLEGDSADSQCLGLGCVFFFVFCFFLKKKKRKNLEHVTKCFVFKVGVLNSRM